MYREVAIVSVAPNPRQPRKHFDEESLSSLSASIRELGVLQPILVREVGDERYELIAGERRWRAARRVGLQFIPALVQEVDDIQSLEQALVENLHRADLDPLEEAAAFLQLIEEFSYTHEQVSQRVGKSRAAVSNSLRLLQLPSGIQQGVAQGLISAGHARALLGSPDRAFQEDLAKRIIAEGLSVRAVEEMVKNKDGGIPSLEDQEDDLTSITPAPQGTAPSKTAATSIAKLRPPGLMELEEILADRLNTRVKVEMGEKKGKVLIEFASLEDLERIYKAMFHGSH
ncbi:MAG: ParB/RepB/Spo0J family partition protein [Acidimicrobiales bacterium]|nr:ParB/RepB/Spo0J family partition protein [Acidimicrobiales bacterium]